MRMEGKSTIFWRESILSNLRRRRKGWTSTYSSTLTMMGEMLLRTTHRPVQMSHRHWVEEERKETWQHHHDRARNWRRRREGQKRDLERRQRKEWRRRRW